MNGEGQGIVSFFQEKPPMEQTILIDLEGSNKEVGSENAESQDDKTKKRELAARKREEIRKEKELKKLQREEEKRKRDLQREEEKRKRDLQREEEKRQRDLRKRQKEIERQEAKQQKEQEKREKEEEKQRKEQEKKIKEERAQSRIGNFFKKISDSGKQLNVKSDYEKYFLPFYAKDGVKLPQVDNCALEQRRKDIDESLQSHAFDDNLKDWLSSKLVKRSHPIAFTAVSLLQQMTAKEKEDQELQSLLKLIPQKYIKFYENVRPPYIGTYSKDVILPVDNPFSTEETDYNYDYDSDLEWINEEDEEGEQGGVDNLESGEDEDDEEDEEASEGEFDGFLDTEEGPDGVNGKRKFLGPLIPTVCLRSNVDSLDEDDRKYYEAVKVEILIEQQSFPIDPNAPIIRSQSISALKRSSEREQEAESASSSPSVSPEKKKARTLITEGIHLLKLFDEIHDSTFSLGTVTEIAQKNLPQYSKQTIKNTVKEYALRGSGKGDSGRKWAIRDMKHWEDLRSSIG